MSYALRNKNVRYTTDGSRKFGTGIDPYSKTAQLKCAFSAESVQEIKDPILMSSLLRGIAINCVKGSNIEVAKKILNEITYDFHSSYDPISKKEAVGTISKLSLTDDSIKEKFAEETLVSIVDAAILNIEQIPEIKRKSRYELRSLKRRGDGFQEKPDIVTSSEESLTTIFRLGIFFKIYAAPTQTNTEYWYESQVYQFVVPHLLKNTPHIVEALYFIYNLTKQDILSLPDNPPAMKHGMKELLLDNWDALTGTIPDEKDKSLGITISSGVNMLGKQYSTIECSAYSFFRNPGKYILKGKYDEDQLNSIMFSILFQLLWTFEVMNRNLVRHNDDHDANVRILINQNNDRKTDHLFVYHLEGSEKNPKPNPVAVCQPYTPYLFDLDRASAYELKTSNSSISEFTDSSICFTHGQCETINGYHDTTVFLLNIESTLAVRDDELDMPNDRGTKIRAIWRRAFQNFREKYLSNRTIEQIKSARRAISGSDKNWSYAIANGGGELSPRKFERTTFELLSDILASENYRELYYSNLQKESLDRTSAQRSDYYLPPKIDEETMNRLREYRVSVKDERDHQIYSEMNVELQVPETYKDMRYYDAPNPTKEQVSKLVEPAVNRNNFFLQQK